jgi:hypothetical protein
VVLTEQRIHVSGAQVAGDAIIIAIPDTVVIIAITSTINVILILTGLLWNLRPCIQGI